MVRGGSIRLVVVAVVISTSPDVGQRGFSKLLLSDGFHKKFRDTKVRCQPFWKQLDTFADFMGSGNVKPATVVARRSAVASFLRWFAGQKKSLSDASLSDAERYLTARKLEGWTVLSRVNGAYAIKVRSSGMPK